MDNGKVHRARAPITSVADAETADKVIECHELQQHEPDTDEPADDPKREGWRVLATPRRRVVVGEHGMGRRSCRWWPGSVGETFWPFGTVCAIGIWFGGRVCARTRNRDYLAVDTDLQARWNSAT